MAGMHRIYIYQNCDACRKALRWLKEHGVAHEAVPIRETPPGVAELRAALDRLGGNPRVLCNTAGADYRELGMKDRLPGMALDELLELLAANGNLVKRPFVSGGGLALAGFKEEAWRRAFLEA
jgi:arsenate reductase (glutaredoxin)